MKKHLLLIGLTFVLSALLQGQNKVDMLTDRPDQSSAPSVMLPGSFQLETGFIFERFNENINHTTYNTSLLRYGIYNHIELRVGIDYKATKETFTYGEIDQNGLSPFHIGAKVLIRKSNHSGPALAVLTTFYLPNTGSDSFEYENLGMEFRLASEFQLADKVALVANLGMGRSGEEENDFVTGLYTAVVSTNLSEKLGVFLELYGFLPEEGDGTHGMDGGFTYSLTDDFQLDLSSGIGLNDTAPDFFISCGFSFRIP